MDEPQTREFSGTPTTTIAAGNTVIAGGDQGAKIDDVVVVVGYPSISIENHATTTGNGAVDSVVSTTPTLSTLGNDAMASTMLEIAVGDESHDGPVSYRNIADILRDAPLVEEEQEEEAFLIEAEEQVEWEHTIKRRSIEKNATWSLTKLPAGHKAIGLQWVFKLKKNYEGEVIMHKARLVGKGYVQRQGVDFDEVFASVARLDIVCVILVMAANCGLAGGSP